MIKSMEMVTKVRQELGEENAISVNKVAMIKQTKEIISDMGKIRFNFFLGANCVLQLKVSVNKSRRRR